MEDSNSEIDLWELLGKGISLFKKRKGLILLFFLLGLLFGLSNFLTHPLEYKSYYKKEFIAQSSAASDEILYDIINGLPPALKSAPEFRSLKGKVEADANKQTRLKVMLEVFEKKDADSILNSIASYVDSIKSLKEKYDLEKKQDIQLLSVLRKKIAECDSAKKGSDYINCIQLIEKKQNIEKELTLNKIINFIEINPDYVLESNTRACVLNMLGWSFLGVVIGFIIAGIMNFIQRK